MPDHLCITIRFLQPYSHARGDGGEPEWPPSPLRVFQALVAAAAARWNERMRLEYAVQALRWLESQKSPAILAPNGFLSQAKCQLFVPDNTSDLLVPAWSKGELSKQVKRTEKVVRPTHLAGEAVHYVYSLSSEGCPHFDVLSAAARSITHLGWGIDMVAGYASLLSEAEAEKLPGHHWRPQLTGGTPLRLPIAGTLDALMARHEAFLGRLSPEGFRPVPPLPATSFHIVGYHSPTVAGSGPLSQRSLAAFEIQRSIEAQEHDPGRSRFRPFDTVRHCARVAGMVRHACAEVAKSIGWDDERIKTVIHGHGDDKEGQSTSDHRFMFTPLPSITPLKVENIRRMLIVGPAGFDMAPFRQRLNGRDLIDEETKQSVAMLSFLSTSDRNIKHYTSESEEWSTVTPVVLPGYDDPDGLRKKFRERVTAEEQKHLLERLDRRVMELLVRAFEQAGWPGELMQQAAIDYRNVGYQPGVELSSRYVLPSTMKFPRYHVRVRFPKAVAGPLVIGAGRYRGIGVFARMGTSRQA